MKIGKLRHRIEVLERTFEVKSGITREHWATKCTLWAEVAPLIGREYFAAAAVESENTVKFRLRYTVEITSAHRIRFEGRLYDIYSVICPNERKTELVIMARLCPE